MTTKIIQQTEHDIILTVGDDVYQADIDTFELEAGGVFPRLPENVEYRIYVPGEKHALVGNHGGVSISGDMPWTIGDNVLNNIDTFIAAQTRADVQAKLQEAALYDDSVRSVQIASDAITAKKIADTAAALVNYYKTKDGLKDYSANERWKKQISGTVSGVFGKLATDDKSYGMLTSLSVAIDKQLVTPPINYKGVDEWVSLTADQVTAIGKEVAGFIQKCFNAELEIAADIEDGKITTTDEIDGAYKAF